MNALGKCRLDKAIACCQIVDGSNGAKARGDSWPAFHKSTVHASPLIYDFDFDNVQDIVLATFDGEILFFKDTVSLGNSLIRPALILCSPHAASCTIHSSVFSIAGAFLPVIDVKHASVLTSGRHWCKQNCV